MVQFSIVVPVYNSVEHVELAVESVLHALQEYGGGELILVDNGSTDGTLELLEARYSQRATLLRIPGAKVGAVRNHGARFASNSILCFLDSDCTVAGDYFQRAAEVFERTGTAATGCEVKIPDDPHWTERSWYEIHAVGRDRYVHYLNAANFLVRADVFRQIGGFDESLPSGEDAEICQRLTRDGYLIYEACSVAAVHLRNPKSLRGFFRRHVWHGMGMFGTAQRNRLDKPTVMTGVHLLATAAATSLLLVPGSSMRAAAGALLGSQLVAPAITLAFRYAQTRRVRRPFSGLFLYWLYFWARATALRNIVKRDAAVYWRSERVAVSR